MHTGLRLTVQPSDQLELIQKRACRLTYGGSSSTHSFYEFFCDKLDILPLSAHRDELANHVFHRLLTPSAYIILFPEKG